MIRRPDLHWPSVAGSILLAATVSACVPASADSLASSSATTPATVPGTSAAAAPATTATTVAAPSRTGTTGPVTSGGASATTVRPGPVVRALSTLRVKGRAAKTGYDRDRFGQAWADVDRNGCDTRNDILDRDLVDKTYVSIKRCPNAVATGTLHDPYTNATVPFLRGAQVGAAVQIDHIVPLALAWDLGARTWTDDMRLRFANDPANLLAVDGPANQNKGDAEPAIWMPPNGAFHCQYAIQFIAVLRGYALPIDALSAPVLRDAAATCPTG